MAASAPKITTVPKSISTRTTLDETLNAFLAPGIAFAEEAPEHVHEATVGDYRVRYLAGEISSVTRR